MADLRRNLPSIIATSAFWIIVLGGYVLFGQRRPPAQPIEILPPPTSDIVAPTASVDPTPAPLRVYVSGAVRAPGVYRLEPDSLVQDAIEQAGGGTEEADLIAINLAHPLTDGEQIYVPALGESPPPPAISKGQGSVSPASGNAELPAGTLIDLNTASAVELESLPGVGPKTAEAIIAGRPYSTVEDLLRVKGIGEKSLEKLRPYIAVE